MLRSSTLIEVRESATALTKSDAQNDGEASVDAFRQNLGPFVVAAEKTRMPMVFTDEEPGHPVYLQMTHSYR